MPEKDASASSTNNKDKLTRTPPNTVKSTRANIQKKKIPTKRGIGRAVPSQEVQRAPCTHRCPRERPGSGHLFGRRTAGALARTQEAQVSLAENAQAYIFCEASLGWKSHGKRLMNWKKGGRFTGSEFAALRARVCGVVSILHVIDYLALDILSCPLVFCPSCTVFLALESWRLPEK